MKRRDVLSLAFVALVALVALVVGCSYEWNVGNGSVDNLPPTFESDSGVPTTPAKQDSGTRDTGAPSPTSGECGPSCSCKGTERCRFTCTKSPCALDCKGDSNCALDCAPGAQCAITCTDKAKCNMDCTAGGSACRFTCKDDASCTGDCRAGSICTRECPRRCNIDCGGGGICP